MANDMLRCLKDTFVEVFFLSSTKPFEVLFSILLFVSALNVLNPLTNIYGNSKTFLYIQWLPESAFGAILLFVALNKLVAVCVNDWKYRAITSAASSILFSFMFVLFYSANPTGMLIPWNGIIGIVSLIIFFRVMTEKQL